jgi:superfamily II DNA or RNA helicase
VTRWRIGSGNRVTTSALHPIQRRYLAEQLVRLRRADEQERYAAAQRQGRIDPNPHQIDAVIFALKRIPEGGCILADEVGLGKTIEAGLILAQLRAEGAASRVLLIVPKPLLGQWQDELFRLFGIQATEGRPEPDGFSGEGVFLAGREMACSERGSALLRESEPFDLCVIDEAHEVFANIYRRFDKHGVYTEDSSEARMADRVRGFLRRAPVLLLTATPIQNNLTELWGLVQYVEPTGTLLGNLRTFRDVFCDGDDRKLVPGQDQELRNRIATVVQRTLRRQAQDFLERPFVARRAQIFEYAMTAREKSLYDDVTAYLLEPRIYAFSGNQRRLLLIGFHRLMASSVKALGASLRKVATRLERMLDGQSPPPIEFLNDLDDDDIEVEPAVDDAAAPDPELVKAELERVRGFIARAETLLRDSKAEKLLDVMRVIDERPADRRKVVIFTESLVTQAYLRDLLIERGGLEPEAITLFRGVNESPRAAAALEHWKEEIGDHLPGGQRPSRSVAVRLALVHEFKTRSRVFISTEAGAKGLNLQFCDTLINYDLPWNPQRIEQRIGRIHRYSQQHDVTVINFLASDNEAQKLMFEILSRKLDLFGKVLDASDVVLHEPSSDTPETLAGALGSDFETRLRRIYERARTVEEIEAELRRLREEMDEERKRYEQTWARTAGLIETRFDSRVKQVFRRLQSELPEGLARLDAELEQLVAGYFEACGIPYRRVAEEGRVRFEMSPSERLPEGWTEGGSVAIGEVKDAGEAGPLHLGHALVRAAVEEARAATQKRFCVTWTLDGTAPERLRLARKKRGRLALTLVRYAGVERVDRLLPIVVMEDESDPLDAECAGWLLEHPPADRRAFKLPLDLDSAVDDAIDELLFADQADVGRHEQQHFERSLEQIDRYVEDQVLVLRRRLAAATEILRAAEDKRDSALGSDARDQAEERIRKAQAEIDGYEGHIERLQNRDDPEYEKWRELAHQRRYRPPETSRILDVEFDLK